MENGREFKTALSGWCAGSETGTAYTPPGSPWVNAFVDSNELSLVLKSQFRDNFQRNEFIGSFRKQRCWQISNESIATTLDRIQPFRRIRPCRSESSEDRPDCPTSSQWNWTADGIVLALSAFTPPFVGTETDGLCRVLR